MKKLLLPILLLSLTGNAQLSKEKDSYLSFSGGFDIRNATVGSAPTQNKPALNYIVEMHAVSRNIDITIGYEAFNEIKYSRMISGLGVHFPLYAYIGHAEIKTTFQPSLEASIIQRTHDDNYTTLDGIKHDYQRKVGFMAYGLNLAFNWDLSDSFAIQTATNIIQRPDKDYLYHESDRYVLSNYLKVILKLNQN